MEQRSNFGGLLCCRIFRRFGLERVRGIASDKKRGQKKFKYFFHQDSG
jgi:hypothetical protein